MRVQVNQMTCEANAICVALLPTVFDLEDDEFVSVVQPEPPSDLEQAVRMAVRSCPKQALRIVEGGSSADT